MDITSKQGLSSWRSRIKYGADTPLQIVPFHQSFLTGNSGESESLPICIKEKFRSCLTCAKEKETLPLFQKNLNQLQVLFMKFLIGWGWTIKKKFRNIHSSKRNILKNLDNEIGALNCITWVYINFRIFYQLYVQKLMHFPIQDHIYIHIKHTFKLHEMSCTKTFV